jgi:septal ring factor EnvC (AmiA/AmiB activator)
VLRQEVESQAAILAQQEAAHAVQGETVQRLRQALGDTEAQARDTVSTLETSNDALRASLKRRQVQLDDVAKRINALEHAAHGSQQQEEALRAKLVACSAQHEGPATQLACHKDHAATVRFFTVAMCLRFAAKRGALAPHIKALLCKICQRICQAKLESQ